MWKILILLRWSFEDYFNNWKKSNEDKPNGEEVRAEREKKSIPRQLQLLFARLQIVQQRAAKTKVRYRKRSTMISCIHTLWCHKMIQKWNSIKSLWIYSLYMTSYDDIITKLRYHMMISWQDLTSSFGWKDSDAFTQHDVQELCRVLFDALENVLKGTEQENFINELYQGTMKDYVRCLVSYFFFFFFSLFSTFFSHIFLHKNTKQKSISLVTYKRNRSLSHPYS